MRSIIITAALALASATALADTSVRGYVRSDGTYVAPHIRSSPNSYKFDNYSARGNTNPYTGSRGTAPSELYPSNPYRSGAQAPQSPYSNPYGSPRRR